jgi:hypothetical protein
MAVELDTPGSIDGLYLERDNPIEPWRPVMTGDVFDGPTVPGCDEHSAVMILSHPCSLRTDGVQLVERVQALPVVPSIEIPIGGWKGNYRVMPLPDLRGDDTPYVAKLTEFGMVPAEDLDLHRRICTLTEIGIELLQQRFFHNQSRVKVELPTLHKQAAPAFVEIELWTQWNEAYAEPRIEHGEDRDDVLRQEGYAFDQVMRRNLQNDLTMRDALKQERFHAEVRRQVLRATESH